MDSLLLLIFVVFAASVCIYLVRRNNKSEGAIGSENSMTQVSEPSRMPAVAHEHGCDIAIFDDNGIKLIESKEILKIPESAHLLESSSSAIGRVQHLASDLFKGASGIPNKTVEVIFKPEIHRGLADGTYTLMRTKTGEVLADAVNSSGEIVGKGRLIQAGKARQLAGGAFQLVSIAVAQSHLADIEKSLSVIKGSISEVLERQENEDKARITGAYDYLREIAEHMKDLRGPDELPQQKRSVIEGIIKDSYSWRNKLEEDMASLIKKISCLSSRDTFGTGDTFVAMKDLVEKVRPLLERRELLLNLASVISFVTAYLDPAQCEYSKVSVNEQRWAELTDSFRDAVLGRESELMKSMWNSNETLQLRKDKLRSLSFDYHRVGSDQQKSYLDLQSSLSRSMSRLVGSDGNVRVAIAFDGQGNVERAAII